MDTGALKKAQPEAIRILVWILSFLSFGYATAEFEVTSDRLGVYRPEEHIEYVSYFCCSAGHLTYLATPKITTTMKMLGSLTNDSGDRSDQSS